jgi:hypothetical protein
MAMWKYRRHMAAKAGKKCESVIWLASESWNML